MKLVQQPRGPSSKEDGLLLPSGVIRFDETRGEMRMHDGLTPGGRRYPNIDSVKALIATGNEGAIGSLRVVATELELQAVLPSANIVAVVRDAGLEETYIWNPGIPEPGDIVSAIDGYWRRTQSSAGFAIRLWQAGFVNLQVNGAEPALNKPTTGWLVNNQLKLWDGTTYVDASPETFTRWLAAIGGYFTSGAGVADRLQSILVEAANVDAINVSGWFKSAAADPNMPIAGVHPIMTLWSTTEGYQEIQIVGSATQDKMVRTRSASVWGGWATVKGQLPTRLASQPTSIADLNAQPDETGWYSHTNVGANVPLALAGVSEYFRHSGNNGIQLESTMDAIPRWFSRSRVAGVWGSYEEFFGGMNPTATTLVDADKLSFRDNATARARQITFANLRTALRTTLDAAYAGLYLPKIAPSATGGLTLTGGAAIAGDVNVTGSIRVSNNAVPNAWALLQLEAGTLGQAIIDFAGNGAGDDYDWRLMGGYDGDFAFIGDDANTKFIVRQNGTLWTTAWGELSTYFAKTGAANTNQIVGAGFEIQGVGAGRADIRFHRPGLKGSRLVLDTDNHLKFTDDAFGVTHTFLNNGTLNISGGHLRFQGSSRGPYSDGTNVGFLNTAATWALRVDASNNLIIGGNRLYIDDGTNYGFVLNGTEMQTLGSGGGAILAVRDSGTLWSSNYGELHDYFARAGAAYSHTFGGLTLQSTGPTLTFTDTDNDDWLIHVNNNLIYFKPSSGGFDQIRFHPDGNIRLQRLVDLGRSEYVADAINNAHNASNIKANYDAYNGLGEIAIGNVNVGAGTNAAAATLGLSGGGTYKQLKGSGAPSAIYVYQRIG